MSGETKLILVEGVPGSGKSAMAQQIALGLQRAGRSARWHHENDRNHPVSPFGAAPTDARGKLAAWTQFIERVLAQDEVVVLESALFQKQLNAFVKTGCEAEIEPFFAALFAVIKPARPLLVHFQQPAMMCHVEWLIGHRGESTLPHFLGILRGTAFAAATPQTGAGLVADYFARVQTLTLATAATFPGERVMLGDARSDWAAAHQRIFAGVGVAPPELPKMPGALREQLAGKYKCVDGVELAEIVSAGEGLRFAHDGVLELVDLPALHFFVDNRPDEFRFVIESGTAPRFTTGAWVMAGSGVCERPVPDRFTFGRTFIKTSADRGLAL